MKELLERLLVAIARGLVDDKDAVERNRLTSRMRKASLFTICMLLRTIWVVVIGKQGRIAKAIRAVMRAGAHRRVDQKIAVEID